MVNATVDNEPVSIQLINDGESTTVPQGETWVVTIMVTGAEDDFSGSNDEAMVAINDCACLFSSGDINEGTPYASETNIVLTSGDEVAVYGDTSDRANAAIQGFVVNN